MEEFQMSVGLSRKERVMRGWRSKGYLHTNFGLLLVSPSKAELSPRFELKVLESGEYRYGIDLKIWGYAFRSYACFSVN